jgi:hypothetical protein
MGAQPAPRGGGSDRFSCRVRTSRSPASGSGHTDYRYRNVSQEVIPRRFNGPPDSANGGYACGRLAAHLGGLAEVTLRRPPPLDTTLEVVRTGDVVELRDGDTLVAEARPAAPEPKVPEPVTLPEADLASRDFAGFLHHAYSTCFVCGPDRSDGLAIYPGPVAGRVGLVAAPWVPQGEVPPELVWAALDCPSGWAVDDFQREGILLGRLTARIVEMPRAGEPHVAIGWRLAIEGRKRLAGSALYTAGGNLLAFASSTWIELASS